MRNVPTILYKDRIFFTEVKPAFLRPLGPTKWCQLLTNSRGIGTLTKRLRLGPSKQTGQYLLTRCAFSLGIPEAVADRYPDAEQLG